MCLLYDAILELGILTGGKHQLKTQGTSKICNICSAQMKVIQNVDTEEVTLTYISTHWNHQK